MPSSLRLQKSADLAGDVRDRNASNFNNNPVDLQNFYLQSNVQFRPFSQFSFCVAKFYAFIVRFGEWRLITFYLVEENWVGHSLLPDQQLNFHAYKRYRSHRFVQKRKQKKTLIKFSPSDENIRQLDKLDSIFRS